jgi:hypothetical protein
MEGRAMTLLELATKYAGSGLSVIPIKADGSKAPAISEWTSYQREIAGPDELQRMFSNGCGIAIVCGRVSGNLEVIDFDEDGFPKQFSEVVRAAGRQELLERLPIVKTPHGAHLFLRCDGSIGGNQKLAQILDSQQRIKTAIETRGEGGYVVTVGSPAACHPSGKPYKMVRGDLAAIPSITAEDRNFLLSAARSLNGYTRKDDRKSKDPAPQDGGGRPGDDFNQRATWAEILEPHGWKHVSSKGDEDQWRRPGKNEGISATTNYNGSGMLYVFSSNAQPFETERGYSKYSAYALLNHNGDCSEASRALRSKGYGSLDNRQAEGVTRNIAQEVREYLESLAGSFNTQQLYSDLGIRELSDKTAARVALHRLKGSLIEPDGNRAGWYRIISDKLREMDLENVCTEELDLWLPLDLHNYAGVMPGNLIVIAGGPDAGKTAALFNIVKRNIDRWACHYFNSEMSPEEFRKRIDLFGDFPRKHKNFHPYERSSDFQDVIRSGKYNLNIVDFLELTEEFYKVSRLMSDIHRRLNGAVAVVAMQTKTGTDLPLGGERAMEKARLAISLRSGNRSEPNTAKILKCKNRKTDHSMIGKTRTYKLIRGSEFRCELPNWV